MFGGNMFGFNGYDLVKEVATLLKRDQPAKNDNLTTEKPTSDLIEKVWQPISAYVKEACSEADINGSALEPLTQK